MTDHTTGSREEWLAARLDLLNAEKEYSRQGDALARQRQELPWVRIDKEYRFDTDEGSVSLRDIFRGRLPSSLLQNFRLLFDDPVPPPLPAPAASAVRSIATAPSSPRIRQHHSRKRTTASAAACTDQAA